MLFEMEGDDLKKKAGLLTNTTNESRRTRCEAAWLAACWLIATWWFFSTSIHQHASYFSRAPAGYYGLQTAGFVSGHMHVALRPAPELLALKDPYDPVANAPYRAHDMTLWKGQYYLYYGVTPVLVAFWPVWAISGWHLTEQAAVAGFCAVGVAIALGLMWAIRRRHFPQAPIWVFVLSCAVVALANPGFRLVFGVRFYEVPIACAFPLQMLMLLAVYRALHARDAAAWWLVTASASFGLSVGSRPNYLLGGVALLIPFFVLVRQQWRRGGFARAVRLAASAFGPAVIVGGGLMLYNWLRFGAIAEFGIKYTLGGERIPDITLMGWRNVGPHLIDYLWRAGTWSRYFPFFTAPGGVPYGALRYAPWLALIPAALLVGGAKRNHGVAAWVGTLAVVTGANLILLTCFFGLTDRYPADYLPGGLLLASVGALVLGNRFPTRRTVHLGLGVLAGITLFFAGILRISWSENQSRWLPLARVLNTPIATIEKWVGHKHAGLKIELELPIDGRSRREPLLHTGIAADARDWLEWDYTSPGKARVSFFHTGLGRFTGEEFAVPVNRRITLEVQCGSLLPPQGHPIFAGWSGEDYERLSRNVRVCVNGVERLRLVMSCYPSPPGDVVIGQTPFVGDGVEKNFTGKILQVEGLVMNPPASLPQDLQVPGPVGLTVRFPVDRTAGRESLLIAGQGSETDVLFCEYLGIGRVRFGLEHGVSSGPLSAIMDIDPAISHRVLVWMGGSPVESGPKAATTDLPWERRLTVLVDGHIVLNREQVFFDKKQYGIRLGNRGGNFTGLIERTATVELRELPTLKSTGERGAVEMTVEFPQRAVGLVEPIVVTGLTGAGNLVYVRYLDAKRVSFGFDHWSVGELVGLPVEIDFALPHFLEITLGSLYAPEEDVGPWRLHVRVRLDGRTVLDGESPCHPATAQQIRIAENPIGGSTCGPEFTGRVLKIQRLPKPKN